MKHLLTFLRHDVSATLALTVGSPSFDRRGTMLKHYAFMLLFLLGSLNVWGETITFKTTTGTEGSTNITSSTNESNILTAGAEYIAFTNKCVKAYYPGKSGLKLGSGSATGTVAFTLSLSNITSITIKTAKYGSDKGTLTFKRGTNSLQTGQTPGNDIVQTFSPAITPGEDVFTIATSEKRAYISEIIVETSSGPAQPTV